MNCDDCMDAYRVVVFTDRTIEGIAALIRHECEHARQLDVHGQNLMELSGMTEEVICERVGGLAGGAILYQAIPSKPTRAHQMRDGPSQGRLAHLTGYVPALWAARFIS